MVPALYSASTVHYKIDPTNPKMLRKTREANNNMASFHRKCQKIQPSPQLSQDNLTSINKSIKMR